jgi:hypothetical protein
MSINNNFFKLRSSSVSYDGWKKMLPTKRGKGFSDVDLLHIYDGHRLCVELKHWRAYKQVDGGLSKSIQSFFEIGQKKGEFGLVMWGEYEDHNLDTENYYSVFTPQMALIYHPHREEARFYNDFDNARLERFFAYWYQWVDKENKKEFEND